MVYPYHLIVEGNPALIYASRGGNPEKVLPTLKPFLEKFWEEREIFGAYTNTPECLVAQLTVRFGFETAEDDFSNIQVGVSYNSNAAYLYWIGLNKDVQIWVPKPAYRTDPTLGLEGCQRFEATP